MIGEPLCSGGQSPNCGQAWLRVPGTAYEEKCALCYCQVTSQRNHGSLRKFASAELQSRERKGILSACSFPGAFTFTKVNL